MFPLENGAFEMLVLGALALIIVGPKDLPMLMRKVGQFTAKMRGLAAEFRASFDEMARQSELDDLRKEVEALRTGQYVEPVSAEIDKHFYDYDQTPASYPSPAETPTIAETPAVAAPLAIADLSAAPSIPAKKPRAKRVAPAVEAPTAPKSRTPRAKPAPEPEA